MTLLEAVNEKSTVKTFSSRTVTEGILRGVLKFSETLQLPLACGTLNLELHRPVREGAMERFLRVRAPYFLFLYTEDQKEGAINAGYAAEQIALYLWTKGIGSCILGFREDLPPLKGEEKGCGAALAFGWPKRVGDRFSLRESALRPRTRLSGGEKRGWPEKVAGRLGLCPEGQRLGRLWLQFSQDGIDCYCGRSKLFGKNLQDSFETGTLLAHIFIAAEELWLKLEAVPVPHTRLQEKQAGRKREYLLSVREKRSGLEKGDGESPFYQIRKPVSGGKTAARPGVLWGLAFTPCTFTGRHS